ncbi:hypothetical protein KKC65_02670 [Patescibacteria group bacterium]|nr:hypothetical protein [Patescibacteria group bacterium]
MIVKQVIFKMKMKKFIIPGILVLAVLINVFIPLLEKSGTSSDIFAQWLEYYPHYPNRLKYIISELSQTTQDLEFFNEKLSNQASQCSCTNASSQCIREGSVGVFGETCNNGEELEKTKLAVKDKAQQMNFLKELLQTEMDTGLAEELERMDEDQAIVLESNLNNIISSSEGVTDSALENVEILDNDAYSAKNQCQAQCNTNTIPVVNACVFGSGGEQNPINMNFEIGVRLGDLNLGRIAIDEVGLNLPDSIQMSDAANIGDFNIDLQDINIAFPDIPIDQVSDLSLDPIVFHPPYPDIPGIPPASFSCTQLDASPYQCTKEDTPENNQYVDLEWFLQTLSWLSDRCQELPGLTDANNNPVQERYEQCFNEDSVHLTIIDQCQILRQRHSTCMGTGCARPPEICYEITNVNAKCQDLFRSEGETAPPICNLNTLRNKCSELKQAGEMNIPEPCKFIPLFNRTLENPGAQTYQTPSTSCAPQTISNHSQNSIRLDCPSLPSINSTLFPRIELPDTIIPDVRLPSFNFMPFLRVRLPSLIFEDLILPDLKPCNLNMCKRDLSSLKVDFQYPSLRIPDIDIPPIRADMPAIPNGPQLDPLSIKMNDIKFPSIPIPMPEIDLTDLLSLDMDLPEISLPQPEVILNFMGIDIDMGNMLLGLVSSIISIPNGCVSAGISGIPLDIGFPDYYFSWPRFPEIPDLCDNRFMDVDKFCKNIDDSLNQNVASKMSRIQNVLDNTIQSQIQNQLDSAASVLKDLITESIHERLNDIRRKVEEAVAESVSRTVVENGMFKIPDAYAILDKINIPMDTVNAELSKIARRIDIPWTEDLKKIPLTNPIDYQLPSIPLGDMSYTKQKRFDLPGFQMPSLDADLDLSGLYPGYESVPPSGGNPYPMDDIRVNIGEIGNTNQSIINSSNEILDVLY